VTEVSNTGVARKPRSLVVVAVATDEGGALTPIVAGVPGTLIALACLVLSAAATSLATLIAVRGAAARALTILTIGAAGSVARVSGPAGTGTGVVGVWIWV